MKHIIEEGSIDPIELRSELTKKFENDYKVYKRGSHITVVAKNNIVGALVIIHKNTLVVRGNFSTMGAHITFTVLVVLLGFLIPIAIYYMTYHKKMKEVEEEVSTFIKNRYTEQMSLSLHV